MQQISPLLFWYLCFFFFFFNVATFLTGRSLIYSLSMFHIIYILPYVLMVKDNNTLINFSLHVNPIDGVDHLIRFANPNLLPFSYPFLKRLPVLLLQFAAPALRFHRFFYLFFFANCFGSTKCVVRHKLMTDEGEKRRERPGFDPSTLGAV